MTQPTEKPRLHPFENPDKNIPPTVRIQLGYCAMILVVTADFVEGRPALAAGYKEAILMILRTTVLNIHAICEAKDEPKSQDD